MKKILLFGSLAIMLIAIPVTIYLVSQQQDIRKKAAPATTLSISPKSITKKVGDEFSLEVMIDPEKNQVVAAEIHLVFDATALEAKTITNGSLFPNVLASGLVGPGTASITVGAPSTTKPVKSKGTVAVIRFKALAPAAVPASVRFANTTFISSLGESTTNVLTSTVPGSVAIKGDTTNNSNPTPSPSPIPTISLSPDANSSASGSGSNQSSGTLEITAPERDTSVSTTKPTIRGTAPPGATVTITVYSTPVTVVVTADANGKWIYTPALPLESGPHTIVATAQASGSGTQTTSGSFVVAAGSGTASQSGVATQSVIPVSGSAQTSIALTVLALLFIATGITIPFLAKKIYV